eukprot:m.50906 g.50906  ORF g.50906 m.50906 type:complete len:64 (+) comp7540_c1_seq3:1640-1831(+)
MSFMLAFPWHISSRFPALVQRNEYVCTTISPCKWDVVALQLLLGYFHFSAHPWSLSLSLSVVE